MGSGIGLRPSPWSGDDDDGYSLLAGHYRRQTKSGPIDASDKACLLYTSSHL